MPLSPHYTDPEADLYSLATWNVVNSSGKVGLEGLPRAFRKAGVRGLPVHAHFVAQAVTMNPILRRAPGQLAQPVENAHALRPAGIGCFREPDAEVRVPGRGVKNGPALLIVLDLTIAIP